MDVSPEVFENTAVAFSGKSDAELKKAKVLFSLFGIQWLVNIGGAFAHFALKLNLPVAPLFRWTVYDHFCGGETFDECKQTIAQLQKSNVGVLLNYGVELKETEADFDITLQKNIEAIEFAAKNKAVKAICIKPTGYGRFALFEKVQRKEKLSVDETAEFEKVKARFIRLCDMGLSLNVCLYFDAEESWIQEALDEMIEELLQKYNREKCIVYNTIQLYRHDRLAYLISEIERSKSGGYLLGVKLVRGAYMEKERERAAQLGYTSPIHNSKEEVDKDYDEAVKLCLKSIDHIFICVASQSEQSNLLAISEMNTMKIPAQTERVVFSQLYGMGDNITFNLAKLGFDSTKYLPYGPVKDVIPYLIRRANENTSVAGQTGRELALVKKELARRKG